MKIAKRILLGLLILIILLTIIGLFFLHNLKNSAIPDYNKSLELTGLTEEVSILRDAHGIPHIYAKNETDLYRSVGFVMAQDRLWQMDLLRRVTQGRLSEILGKDQINTDLLMRALRIQEKSEKVLQSLQPEIITAVEAFAKGMNYYIENYPLPPEFKVLGYKPEPWQPVHSLNLIGYMSWDLSSGWGTEILLNELKKELSQEQLLELIPDLDKHKTAIYPNFILPEINIDEILLSANKELEKLGVEVFQGSNNWAVSGKKSISGKPLLANDMHLGLFAPGIWYQMHQNVAGKVNVTGLVLPGQPFVIAGHNDSIAWGMTNVMVDDLDFYAEKLNNNSTKYLLDGEWKNLDIKNEIIKTKEGEEIIKTLKFTHRGPIVNQLKKEKEIPLSIHWVGS
ncbi:MAG: penicillin acylase family protein, partial [Bacteroidetes bacterium]|nr:penicillin acylase family protein [Bacteroidota bacterium]